MLVICSRILQQSTSIETQLQCAVFLSETADVEAVNAVKALCEC